MFKLNALFCLLLGSASSVAAESPRFIETLHLPSGQTLVVAEGDFEARSLGSFSVRLYAKAAPGDETTFFRSGLILPRDGTLESVMLADIDNDGQAELIINIRAAGTGSYRSAYALAISTDTLRMIRDVTDLGKQADTLHALRQAKSPTLD